MMQSDVGTGQGGFEARDRQLGDLSIEDDEHRILMESEIALRFDPGESLRLAEEWGGSEADRYVKTPAPVDPSTLEALADDAGF